MKKVEGHWPTLQGWRSPALQRRALPSAFLSRVCSFVAVGSTQEARLNRSLPWNERRPKPVISCRFERCQRPARKELLQRAPCKGTSSKPRKETGPFALRPADSTMWVTTEKPKISPAPRSMPRLRQLPPCKAAERAHFLDFRTKLAFDTGTQSPGWVQNNSLSSGLPDMDSNPPHCIQQRKKIYKILSRPKCRL